MHLRVQINSPFGEHQKLDVAGGVWEEPSGVPDRQIGDQMWALPGLIDAHSHLARVSMDFQPGDPEGAKTRAAEALRAGVMLLLDKGWRDLTVVDLIDRVPQDQRPTIEAAGVMHTVAGGYYDGFAKEIAPGGIADAVRQAAVEGRGWVKLVGDWPRKGVGPMPNFTENELRTAVSVASEHDSKVAIHTMAPEVPSAAVRAGVQSIEHGLFLTAGDITSLGARGGMWVPTVVQMEAIVAHLGAESSGGRLLLQGLDNVSRLLGDAVDAGVRVLTGTDLAISSAEVAKEAVRLFDMGMTASAVVRAVSSGGFQLGDAADVVMFDANPLDDPAVLSHPRHVIRMGRQIS